MRKKWTTSALPVFALGLGLVIIGLRGLLYSFCIDEKGILSASHLLHQICLVLAVGWLVFLAFRVRELGGNNDPQENFSLWPWAVAAAIAGGYLTIQHGLQQLAPNTMNVLRLALTLLAAISMVVSLFLKDKRGIAFRVYLCLYFSLEMLLRYRSWSGNPQLPDYVFHVAACASLAVCAYQRLAFDVGLGHRRWLLYWGLAAIFLCLSALVGPENWEYYLGSGLWAFSALCRLDPPVITEEF